MLDYVRKAGSHKGCSVRDRARAFANQAVRKTDEA